MKRLLLAAVKRDIKRIALLPRKLNAHARALPGFIIIGAQRCGTSSLYAYLVQHPQIHAATYKEVHYFDKNLHKGESWYRAQFPLERHVGSGGITGEASPSYLYLPEVPPLIHALLPDVKLIVLLRDPVKRAISHYHYERKMGREVLSLTDAINFEERQDAGETLNRSDYSPGELDRKKSRSYMKRGLYLEQLERYTRLFDAEQIHVLRSEELFANTSQLLRGVYEFLGCDTEFSPGDLSQKNSANLGQDVPVDIIDKLTEYYRKPNKMLYEYLQRDFGWM